MKKLLLLLLLVGFNANGEEFSRTGLEGIAEIGLKIIVEDYSDLDKTFDKKAMNNRVELKLRLAGIRVNNRAGNYIHVDAHPIRVGGRIVGYAMGILAYRRDVTFEANNKQYRCSAAVWKSGGIAPAVNDGIDINTYMDQFLADYLKANPKKEK